jgi:phosphoribosylamine--glycine ligase
MAAHLPGVIASFTTLPVIGVPLDASSLNGMDALLSIVQMPPGIPVATVSIGKAGAKNAGILAAQIIAVKDKTVARKLVAHRAKMYEEVEEKARGLESRKTRTKA